MPTKKAIKTEGEYLEKEAVESIRRLHKGKGQLHLLYLWKNSTGKRYSLWTLYPQISGRNHTLLQRGQLPRTMLQLQHKSLRKSVCIWGKTRNRKGGRTSSFKTTNKQVVRRGLPTKNGILYKVK